MSAAPRLATPGKTRLGWIGLGVMGAPMCGHLVRAGFETTVYTRTPAKAAPLLERGARWAEGSAEVAAASDVVFTMLGLPEDVREVVLAPGGALSACQPGAVLVDMTTSEPSLAREIARLADESGAHAVDAPVSGGDVGAREARLSIMVGGEEAAVAAVMPCLEALGRTVVRQGGPGAGQHTKLVNQTLIASTLIGVCEGLLYAHRAGLDLPTVLESVASGAAGSWQLSNLAPRIVAGDFAPGFFVEHLVKDLRIALDEAARMQLALPGLGLARQMYQALAAQGHARDGTQALQLALARLSGIDWPGAG